MDDLLFNCRLFFSLCAIYVTSDKRSVHESALNSLRRLVASSSESDEQLADWLKFVFVMDYKQQSFVKSLRDEEEAPVKSEVNQLHLDRVM